MRLGDKMLSDSSKKFAHLGLYLARYYHELWNFEKHIRRRVYTNEILDRAVLKQQATIDLDWAQTKKVWDTHFSHILASSVYDSRRTGLAKIFRLHFTRHNYELKEYLREIAQEAICIIPLLRLRKGMLYDVSVRNPSGEPIHLCRSRVNREISAYIILGFCLEAGLQTAQAESIFDLSMKYLEESREYNSIQLSMKAQSGGVKDLSRLQILLRQLRSHYVQCIEVASPDDGISIIKFQTADSFGKRPPAPELEVPEIPLFNSCANAGGGKPTPPRGNQQSTIQGRFRKQSRASELLGIKAMRFIIDAPELAYNKAPVHLRMLAPKGTMIDDAALLPRNQSKPEEPYDPTPEEGYVSFNHQRAIVLNHRLPSDAYRFLLKLNPKRSIFLVPAICILGLQAAILIFVLMAGPERVQRHDSAILAALFFIFPLLTILVAREGEHELMSEMLAWGRGFAVASGSLQVLCGLLLATLPQIEAPPKPPGPHQNYAMWMLVISLHWTLIVLYLFILQCIRISAVRGIINMRRSTLKETGSSKNARATEKSVYKKLLWGTIICSTISILVYAYLLYVYAIPHIAKAWLL